MLIETGKKAKAAARLLNNLGSTEKTEDFWRRPSLFWRERRRSLRPTRTM